MLNEIEKLAKALARSTLELTKAANEEAKSDMESVVSSIADYGDFNLDSASVSTVHLTEEPSAQEWIYSLSVNGQGPGLKHGEYYGVKVKGEKKAVQLGPRGGIKRSDTLNYVSNATLIYKFDTNNNVKAMFTLEDYRFLFKF